MGSSPPPAVAWPNLSQRGHRGSVRRYATVVLDLSSSGPSCNTGNALVRTAESDGQFDRAVALSSWRR